MNTSFGRQQGSDEWYTPSHIVKALGEFDLDPCTPVERLYDTAKIHYKKFEDDLSLPWSGRVWLNPPYSRPLFEMFLRKLVAHNDGIVLICNRADTAVFQELVFNKASAILFMLVGFATSSPAESTEGPQEQVLYWLPTILTMLTSLKLVESQVNSSGYANKSLIFKQVNSMGSYPKRTQIPFPPKVEGEGLKPATPEQVANSLLTQDENSLGSIMYAVATSLNAYQVKALKYKKFPEEHKLTYPALGLNGEAGEVAEKVKKIIRDKGGELTQEDRTEIAKELGDVLWYVAILAEALEYPLAEIGKMNIEKLESRYQRNKINGNGDNR